MYPCSFQYEDDEEEEDEEEEEEEDRFIQNDRRVIAMSYVSVFIPIRFFSFARWKVVRGGAKGWLCRRRRGEEKAEDEEEGL